MASNSKRAKHRLQKAIARKAAALGPQEFQGDQERPSELERAVANVERILESSGAVTWNEKLPTRHGPRQFDVVVRAGSPGRQFTTVFEVQGRSRPVTMPMYESWLPKVRSSSAERLICVSEAGFTQPVRRAAAAHNSRTRLITFRSVDAPPTPQPTGLGFVELEGFLSTEEVAMRIHAGSRCFRLECTQMPLTIEDLVWRRNFSQGWRMQVDPPLRSQRFTVELAPRDEGKLFFTPEMGGAEIRRLTVVFAVVGFTAQTCVVQDAAYWAVADDAPMLWATHARVRAWGQDAEVTLATVRDNSGGYSIVQLLSTPDGKPLTRALPNLNGPLDRRLRNIPHGRGEPGIQPYTR